MLKKDTDKTLRALVVEDYDIARMVHMARFQQIGYNVVKGTSNFQEALRIIEQHKFDVYLVDGRFPDAAGEPEIKGNGIRIYPIIKENNPAGRFILFSGDTTTLDEAKNQGIEAYHKLGDVSPFDILSNE